MVGKSFMQSTALAVLAAVGAMAVPARAQDADQQQEQAARSAMREARQEQRAERQAGQQESREAPQAAAPQQQAQSSGGGRDGNRGGGGGGGNGWQGRAEARQQAPQQQQATPQQRSTPDGGWRSQRAPDGQRYGRNWESGTNGGGTVNRPAPAWRGETPQTPDRGVSDQARAERWGTENAGRNRTYSDPNRNGSYGSRIYDRSDERSAQDWPNHQGDRNTTYRPGYRDGGYRDGRSADNYRDRRDQTQAYRYGYNSSNRDHRQWDRDDWRRDNRYNWSGYRNQHRSLFNLGQYYSPYNKYSYSRLSIGFFLDRGFYGQNYWINDPYQYRLPEVYGPYRWVRYYDDVLLVDIYSGEVVDVIHDFFW